MIAKMFGLKVIQIELGENAATTVDMRSVGGATSPLEKLEAILVGKKFPAVAKMPSLAQLNCTADTHVL